jgi:5-methylcytosine-specific restriction protein A
MARLKAFSEWGLAARSRKSLWDADHIVPVIEGGGECDLTNLRTLCLKCHRASTTDLRKRRGVTAGQGSSGLKNRNTTSATFP